MKPREIVKKPIPPRIRRVRADELKPDDFKPNGFKADGSKPESPERGLNGGSTLPVDLFGKAYHAKRRLPCAEVTPQAFAQRLKSAETLAWGVAHAPFAEVAYCFCDDELFAVGFLSEGRRAPEAVEEQLGEIRRDVPAGFLGRARRDDALARRHSEGFFHADENSARAEGSIKLLLVGTPFQRDVWRALASIPAASVTFYSDIASCLHKESDTPAKNYSRAVGGAVGSNPLPWVVPCHRVVPAQGGLGNFGGGANLKDAMLRFESTP